MLSIIELPVPTVAELKKGIVASQAKKNKDQTSNQARVQNNTIDLTLRHQCGICRRSNDQHLLAKCDTCHLHYHLECLTPPLTRMPKKTKLFGW